MKRLFDIFFSLIGLLMLLPVFMVMAILIKLDSPGPVFFKQERMGRNFRPFFIYKFRSMVNDAHKKGLQITAGGDARVTRSGWVLRKTKIDELPQLINVLKGEMSFVGPRPEVKKYVDLYKDDYNDILRVRPGITDISSIVYRDEEGVLQNQDNPEEYYKSVLLPEKLKLAKKYVAKSSFFYDLRLILLTIFKIIFPADKTARLSD
ncbi:MAG: sugar transferase [Nitrospirae bacterium]|nr:sugar transferase [Nitrospirota bacterium]